MGKTITFLNNNSVANITTNFQRVNTALEDVLSLSGELPNSMEADLDMNSNDILNVGTIQANDITIDGNDATGILQLALEAAEDAEGFAGDSENSAIDSAISASEAAGYAAGLNLPAITAGTTNYQLNVNLVEDGYDLLPNSVRASFTTVTELLADTSLDYTRTNIGDIIEAQGFRYEVATSGAADHDLTTAGGVKLYVLAPYNVLAFGDADTPDLGNVYKNQSDYATLGSSIVPPVGDWTRTNFDAAGVHTAGTVGELITTCTGLPYSYYLLKVVISTTTPGLVKILQGGADIIGDTPNGIPFSNAAVLNDATENNRYVDDTTYYFTVATSATGFSDFSFETDTTWAGSITEVELLPVSINDFVVGGASVEDAGAQNPVGLRVGAYNRGDIALGDKFTLGAFQYDGVSPTPAFNVAVGTRALATNTKGDQNTAIGSLALQYNEGSNNVGVGYSAAKLNTKGQEIVAIGYKCMVSNTTGFRNTGVGFWAGGLNTTGKENTSLGWYAARDATAGDNNTNIGSRAGRANKDGSLNTYVGSLAGASGTLGSLSFDHQTMVGAESWGYGDGTTSVGHQARVGTSSVATDDGIAVGRFAVVSGAGDGSISIGALSEASGAVAATAVGYDAAAVGDRAVAIGEESVAGNNQTTAVGGLTEANGEGTTSLGAQAGRNNTGANNTFVGRIAGNLAVNAYGNCSILGAGAAVTGSNQVQLGDSATTTYVYGTVQNRSDIRDKADVDDSNLGIDFVLGLRPVHGRWDMREDYRSVDEDGNVSELPKDGSKKRSRLHQWFIAQEVQELCEKLGVEFGGIQHHAKDGGEDVYSLGYDEFIPPVVNAVQECWSRMDELERRIKLLEG